MALSVTIVESTPHQGFHPEPRQENEHHADVFKKKTVHASVAIVNDKAQSYCSSCPIYQEVSRTSATSIELQSRIGVPPLPKTEHARATRHSTPLITHTIKGDNHHHHHGTHRRATTHTPFQVCCPSILGPKHRQALTSQHSIHDRRSTGTPSTPSLASSTRYGSAPPW